MTTTIRGALLALGTTAIIIAALALNTSTAQAQCSGVTINNNTNCDLLVCFYNALSQTYCQTVVSNSSAPATWPAGFKPIGIVSAGGNQYPFVPAPPAAGCTQCISLQIPGTIITCCAMVCPNPPLCVININPCPAPCLP